MPWYFSQITAAFGISKFSLMKLHADVSQRSTSESFKKCPNRLHLQHNKRKKGDNHSNNFGSCVIAVEQYYARAACSQLPFFIILYI